MTKPITDPRLDLRTRERALREGALTKDELAKHLKSLPDEASNCEEISNIEESAATEGKAKSALPGGLTFSAIEG